MSDATPPSGFDPNAAPGEGAGIFGLACPEEAAALVYLPVPWEGTVSYGGGTSGGPRAILAASRQVDLFDLEVLRPYEPGLHMLTESEAIRRLDTAARADAQASREAPDAAARGAARARVNACSDQLNDFVAGETRRLLTDGKLVGVVGGEHSVAFGALRALAEARAAFGILQFDAHCDTRVAYEGFDGSHASIMHNVLERIPQVTSLVQVGVRDFCEQELAYGEAQADRVRTWFDVQLARRKFEGEPWAKIAGEIVAALPQEVWISFDVDALDPALCPHTGTPVPGGLGFNEANFLLGEVVRSGRSILGFDLCEVAPGPGDGDDGWDANVGARLLYRLSAWTLASRKLCALR